MLQIQWAKIRQWHVLRPYDHFGPASYCGRSLEGCEVVDELPGSANACGTCESVLLRLIDDAKEAD